MNSAGTYIFVIRGEIRFYWGVKMEMFFLGGMLGDEKGIYVRKKENLAKYT